MAILQAPHPQDVDQVLKSLPVQKNRDTKTEQPEARFLLDTLASEAEEPTTPGDSPAVQAMLKGFVWLAYSAAIVAAILLTWESGAGILKFAIQR